MDVFSPNSSGSGSGSGSGSRFRAHSDEDVKLASSHPKKRAGRKKFKETRHPVYRGIRKRNNDKWVCELREPNKQARIWLGTYPTAEMAARAHDVAALAFRGKSACLNFADSAWRLPAPASMDAKDIRKAAAEAADQFRTQMSLEVSGFDDQARQEEAREVVATNETSAQDLKDWTENMFSVDEHMPGLLFDMADGLLISPPPMGDYTSWDNMGGDGDISLWSYSM